MSAIREQQLAEILKYTLYGIQKSKQIYDKLSKWEKRALNLNEEEIDEVSKLVAANVETWVVQNENNGQKPSVEQIKQKIGEVLENYAE